MYWFSSLITSSVLDYYSVSPSIPWSPFSQGSLTLYISLWMILALHLSTVQFTAWVLVPLDTFTGPLWVKATKAALFKDLLDINAARELVVEHSMRWLQLFLKYFLAPIFPVRSQCISLSIELPETSFWTTEHTFWPPPR